MEVDMKYSDVHVYSHQRSGSHYVTALVDANFFNGRDYIRHYKNHPIGPQVVNQIVNLPQVLFLYVWRDFYKTAQSIFKQRKRFGLHVESYDDFLASPYNQMWSNENEFDVVTDYNYLNRAGQEVGVSYYFANINMTPKKFWEEHLAFWRGVAAEHENVHLMKFDDLLDDFNGELAKLAKAVGSDKTEFVNIEERVGWS